MRWHLLLYGVAGCGEPDPEGARDVDRDGYDTVVDCDDDDPAVFPGAEELPGNGLDEDCDGWDGFMGPVSSLGAWPSVRGEAFHALGVSVAGGHDLDGDGRPDAVVGAPGSATETTNGRVVVVGAFSAGASRASEVALATYEEVDGHPHAQVGYGVVSTGDVDGDGHADVLLSQWYHLDAEDQPRTRAARLLLGPFVPGGRLDQLDVAATFEAPGSGLSPFVGDVGDLDGDGDADLVLAVPAAPSGSPAKPGLLGVYFDPPSGFADVASTADLILTGAEAGDGAGTFTGSAGDTNGDGIDDLLVAAWPGDSGPEGLSSVYLVEDVRSTADLGSANTRWFADDSGTDYVSSVGSAGDANGDGYADVLLGDEFESTAAFKAGKVHLLLGPFDYQGPVGGDADAFMLGEDAYDWLGRDTSPVGDTDGDGADAYALAATRDLYFGLDRPGRVYVFEGVWEGAITRDDASVLFVGEEAGDAAGEGLSRAGDMDSDGCPDLLIGAPGALAVSGRAYLVSGCASAGP